MRYYSILWCLLFNYQAFGQLSSNHWADSILSRMSMDEKVRQLFMVPISPNQINPTTGTIDQVVNSKPGGILITSGGPGLNARLISRLQNWAATPMLVAIEAEWGIGQTLDSVNQLPRPVILGATSDSMAYVTGKIAARQMKIIGAHLNIGLNVDVDIPEMPSSITDRYLGDQPDLVVSRAEAFNRGVQEGGALSMIRHLPGRIQNDFSAYRSMASKLNLDSISFIPFIKLLQRGAHSINTSNIHYGMMKKNKNILLPQSMEFIPEILRSKIGFEGLVTTEVSYVQNFSSKRKGEAEKLAFQTDHDILISPRNMEAGVRKIMKLVKRNPALQTRLNQSVRRILEAKFLTGAHLKNNYTGEIDRETKILTDWLNFSAHSNAITVLKNDLKILPILELTNRRFFLIKPRLESELLEKSLNKYTSIKSIDLNSFLKSEDLSNLQKNDVVILVVNRQSGDQIDNLLIKAKDLSEKTNLIVLHGGHPDDLINWMDFPVVVECYQVKETESLVAQILFGALPSKGILPFENTSIRYPAIQTPVLSRLSYALPEVSQMSSLVLDDIDLIAQEAIQSGATPGCRVLLARKGKIVFDRSYGFHTYDKSIPVTDESIYDLASVTKVAATLQTTMYLYDRDQLDLQKKISVYLPELRFSNKRDFTLKDILTHQAGLWPYLPFWTRTMKDGELLPEFYNTQKSPEYPFDVSENLFASKAIKDSLWSWIIQARIIDKKDRTPFDYRYSDMGFYILQHLAESKIGQPIEDFLNTYLYDPVGARTTGFLPLKNFPARIIAPTEEDKGFRKTLLTGYVHDQGAAMHGGIAGHAGLFSNANDLAKLGQMWLQQGYYGGKQFFKPETIRLFTTQQFEGSRRGLGWDKPWPNDPNANPTGSLASPKTFGHTGFTGTCIWVDPEQELVYVFLSNRVHPDMNNSKLINANIRTRIHDIAYKSIQAFQVINP